MNLLFCGTPEFARTVLCAIHSQFSSSARISVLTAPPRPAGRGMRLSPSPVAQFAKEHTLPVYTPQTLKDHAFETTLQTLEPDLCIVAAYGKILPEYFLNAPRLGCINVHASLLPEYRGAAPIERAILDGKKRTGITIMQMDKGLDTGDILFQDSIPIAEDDTAKSLTEKLSGLGAKLIVAAIRDALDGRLHPIPQDDARSNYAQKLSREDERIDWSQSAAQTDCRIRAFAPRPGASARLENGEELKICQARLTSCPAAAPGTVRVQSGRVFVSAGDLELELLRIKPQGKGEMDAIALINGRKLKHGDRLS